MTTTPTHTAALASLAQADTSVDVDGTLGAIFLAAVVLSVLLGLATAALAVYRYRRRGDPALRAFVVGLVLVAVAPLPFRVFLTGTIPPVVREVAPAVFQSIGLVAILWAMYGDPRPAEGRWVHTVTRGDLGVVAGALAAATVTVALGGLYEPSLPVIVAAGAVVALATFVAGQAARAAYRYRAPALAALSAGIFLLVALPVPVGSLLIAAGLFPDAVAVGFVAGSILFGEAAMFVTLVYR